MLELHVENNDVSGGTIGVGWCVSPDTIDFLAKQGVKNPAIVLCTAPVGDKYHSKREFRKVVNLRDLVGYVEFRTAGPNNVWGFIVADEKRAKNKFLSRWSDGSGYNAEVLAKSGDEWPWFVQGLNAIGYDHRGAIFTETQIKEHLLAETVEVNVPAGCFAPEPAAWEKTWVNHFFGKDSSVDQCDFRRRRLFAYTLQPIILTLSVILRLGLFLGSAFIGSRGTDIKTVIQPMTYSLASAFETTNLLEHGNFFVGRGDNAYLNYLRLLFLPPFLLLYYVLWTTDHTMGIVGVFTAGLVIALTAFLAVAVHKFATRKKPVKVEIEEEPLWYLDKEELSYIVCNAEGKKATSFDTLPAAKKTVYLRFQNLKSKVCRPFSA